MWNHYYRPTTRDEALALLRQHAGRARLIAGGTDLLIELQRSGRRLDTAIDLTALTELRNITLEGDTLRIGALATHNDIVGSPLCTTHAPPLAQACREVGAPQIRNRATIAGNLVTASPANDTITALLALDAAVTLQSATDERTLPLAAFYSGFRTTVLQPDELLCDIRVPALHANQRGLFLKLGLRRAQAIAVINVAVVVTFDSDTPESPVRAARIALGCVAPTVVRATAAEALLVGRPLSPQACREAGEQAARDIAPIDDVRGGAAYRRATVASLVSHALSLIAAGDTATPPAPPMLATPRQADTIPLTETVHMMVNGAAHTLPVAAHPTLLDALRDGAGLTGTKSGCAEGECGACTVWLNGQAVMACLVPAAQAHGARVTTIEGLAAGDRLHPLQQAFIDHAAVQCGYCIPGFLMAGAKLLEEIPAPDRATAQDALCGNICRCTGYRKILDAVVAAGEGGAR